MRAGKIAVVRTSDPVAYLGGILYELGAIDIATLNATLHEVATHKRLHGAVLLERAAIDQARLADGLAEQTFRKTHHLFTLPEDATWAFRDDVDDLTGARDEDRPPIDTWKAIWRGLRDQPTTSHVRKTLAKVDGPIQLRELHALDAFGLATDERAVCERLFAQPTTLAQLTGGARSRSSVPSSSSTSSRSRAASFASSRSRSAPPSSASPGFVRRPDRSIGRIPRRSSGSGPERPSKPRVRPTFASHVSGTRAHPEALAEVRSECEHIFIKLGEAHRVLTDTTARRLAGEKINTGADDAADDGTPKVTMRDVDAALAREELSTAEGLAKVLSNGGSEGPAARAVIAWCTAGAGRSSSEEALERGLAALEKLLTGDPDCVRALYYRAQICARLGRVDAALRDYAK